MATVSVTFCFFFSPTEQLSELAAKMRGPPGEPGIGRPGAPGLQGQKGDRGDKKELRYGRPA